MTPLQTEPHGAVRTADGAVPQPVLEARRLYRFFRSGDEETLALRGVSLQVRPGNWLR